MKLALGTSWLVFTALAVWAVPTPARPGVLSANILPDHVARRMDDACAALSGSSIPCLVARQDASEPPSSTSETPTSTATSESSPTFTSATTFSSSTDMPVSSTSQSTHSLTMSHSSTSTSPEAQSNANSNSSSANNQLRTIGIVGGLLAGIALIAIICIILILLRNYRLRGSLASGSIRSRTRTRSNPRQQPVPFLTQQVGDPIMRPPALRIHTGDAMTMVSHDAVTTAGTLGHHGGLQPFPASGHDSASSRTTSFGHHSASTGPSNNPRRAPQLPSLGLSQPRPLLRSFGSTFSFHGSAGHLSAIVQEDRTQTSAPAAPSTTGSKTEATTEEADRTDVTSRTEETRTMPVEESHAPTPKPE